MAIPNLVHFSRSSPSFTFST